MALIECLECRKQVSDKAATCPHCGAPRAPVAVEAVSTTTIEQTGKVHKTVQLVGVLMILASVVACVAGAATQSSGTPNAFQGMALFGIGTLLCAVGVLLWIGGRLSAWWSHG